MAWPDYEMKKNILRILTIASGLFSILPTQLAFLEYRLFDILALRVILGIAAIVFVIGSWKKLW